MKREGKRATQVRKHFFSKGGEPLESQPCFPDGKRICAKRRKILSAGGRVLGGQVAALIVRWLNTEVNTDPELAIGV